jgi:hypothetical protein
MIITTSNWHDELNKRFWDKGEIENIIGVYGQPEFSPYPDSKFSWRAKTLGYLECTKTILATGQSLSRHFSVPGRASQQLVTLVISGLNEISATLQGYRRLQKGELQAEAKRFNELLSCVCKDRKEQVELLSFAFESIVNFDAGCQIHDALFRLRKRWTLPTPQSGSHYYHSSIMEVECEEQYDAFVRLWGMLTDLTLFDHSSGEHRHGVSETAHGFSEEMMGTAVFFNDNGHAIALYG